MAVHVEWIHAGSFDKKFKNTLRDYFKYGFKTFDSYPAEDPKTLREDWERLNNILGDYLEWSEDPEQILFATLDSQSAEMNVFQRVYRFCGFRERDPAYFLHVLSALCPDIFLREGIEGLELEKQQRLVRSKKKKTWRAFDPMEEDEEWVLQLANDLKQEADLSTAELMCFYPDGMPLFSGENRKTNIRLQKMADLGLLRCVRQVEKGNRRWALPRESMARILEAGSQANPAFVRHFQLALDFYARFLPLGELGLFLLDRLGTDRESPFRFKHEYYTHALNDFHLADLLHAMEQGLWCLIRYRHGVTDQETQVLCFPLEIRISAVNGRESLMYYEPFLRSYSSLRLEFMDSVQYLKEETVRELLHAPAELLQGDIAYAARSLEHTWGLSTTPEQRGNAIPGDEENVTRVRLRVAYDPVSEAYVPERLAKGKRLGRVEQAEKAGEQIFTVDVTDTSELRPWVRSFYSRLLECQGMDTRDFSVEQDVRDMEEALERETLLSRRLENWRSWFPYGVPPLYADALNQAAEPAREHDKLFHETFSSCYHVMGRVFARLCAHPEADVAAGKGQDMIREALGDYCHIIGMETENFIPGQLRHLFLAHGFASRTTVTEGTGGHSVFSREGPGYRIKYGSRKELDFYRDVVPLTCLELRWLRTMLEDTRVGGFLEPEEQQALRRFLQEASGTEPLPMEKITFFDRNRTSRELVQREVRSVKELLDAIDRRQVVWLQYRSAKGKRIAGRFRPIILEFSKKDNRFQGYLQSCRNQAIYILNLSGIQKMELTGESFDNRTAQEALDRYRAERERSVELVFFDVRNLAERLLTEFSPWKKRCAYEKATGLYRLTLFYQASDENELVLRLMGYGADLRITDSGHPIRGKIREKVRRQLELLQQRKKRGRPSQKSVGKENGRG